VTDGERFRLSLLLPAFQPRVREICERVRARGFREPYIGSTFRTPEEQLDALKRGTTGRKQKLSWHMLRRAVDIRDRLPNGSPDPTTRNEAFFLALWEEATLAGCRSLAYVKDKAGYPVKLYINGGKLWDAGHIELREPYSSLIEACRAEAPHLLGEPPDDDPDDDEDGSRLRALGLAGLPPSPFK
jgi:hypothetical protein